MKKGVFYDVIVIGAGPAGLTASLYLKRLGLSVLVIEKSLPGGKLNEVPYIDNYPGFPSIRGFELGSKFFEHVSSLGVEFWYPDEVIDVESVGGLWKVTTRENRVAMSYAIIIATGMERAKGVIDGELEFVGKGVSYCAVCDGPLFRNKVVAVIGGSERVVKEAEYLANIASRVYLVLEHEDEVVKAYLPRLKATGKVEVIKGKAIRIKGTTKVENLVIKLNEEQRELKVDGVFIAREEVPNTALFKKIGIKTDERGFIVVDREQRTNVNGVFAAGDVTGRGFQVVVACGDGAVAALSAYRYITSIKRAVTFEEKVVKLRLDGKVAYARYRVEGKRLVIESVYVPEEYRGYGIGKRLVLEIVKHAKDKGLEVVAECDFAQRILDKYSVLTS